MSRDSDSALCFCLWGRFLFVLSLKTLLYAKCIYEKEREISMATEGRHLADVIDDINGVTDPTVAHCR